LIRPHSFRPQSKTKLIQQTCLTVLRRSGGLAVLEARNLIYNQAHPADHLPIRVDAIRWFSGPGSEKRSTITYERMSAQHRRPSSLCMAELYSRIIYLLVRSSRPDHCFCSRRWELGPGDTIHLQKVELWFRYIMLCVVCLMSLIR
jgi:hypothetical protein